MGPLQSRMRRTKILSTPDSNIGRWEEFCSNKQQVQTSGIDKYLWTAWGKKLQQKCWSILNQRIAPSIFNLYTWTVIILCLISSWNILPLHLYNWERKPRRVTMLSGPGFSVSYRSLRITHTHICLQTYFHKGWEVLHCWPVMDLVHIQLPFEPFKGTQSWQ